jgi:hypothetical protein
MVYGVHNFQRYDLILYYTDLVICFCQLCLIDPLNIYLLVSIFKRTQCLKREKGRFISALLVSFSQII